MNAPRPIARALSDEEKTLYEMGYKEGLIKASELARDQADVHKKLSPLVETHTSLNILGLKLWHMAKTNRDPIDYYHSRKIAALSVVVTLIMIAVGFWRYISLP